MRYEMLYRGVSETPSKLKNFIQEGILLKRVSIVRPGGNDTAIVWDAIPRSLQGSLSKIIQAAYKNVEQVMFVEKGAGGLIRGQMAGGEFCGNATRSLGFLVMRGENGQAVLEISGAQHPISVIVRNGMVETSLPIRADLNSVQSTGGVYNVHLDGISFMITARENGLGNRIISAKNLDEQKSIVLKALKENGFASLYPASGILVIDMQDDASIKLEPFVYVRETETLYHESGCGSGSASIGLMLAKKSGLSLKNLKITQPSGMDLYVSVERNAGQFKRATINGPIELLFDGSMYLPPSREVISCQLLASSELV